MPAINTAINNPQYELEMRANEGDFYYGSSAVTRAKQNIKKEKYGYYSAGLIQNDIIHMPSEENFDKLCWIIPTKPTPSQSSRGIKPIDKFGVVCRIERYGKEFNYFFHASVLNCHVLVYNDSLNPEVDTNGDRIWDFSGKELGNNLFNASFIFRTKGESEYDALKSLAGKDLLVSSCRSVQTLKFSNTEWEEDGSKKRFLGTKNIYDFAILNNDIDNPFSNLVFSEDKKKVIDVKSKSVEELFIPKGIVEILDNAFIGCDNIKRIIFSETVQRVSGTLFDELNTLINIEVDDNNIYYSSEDGVLFNKSRTEIIRMPIGKKTINYSIPNGVVIVERGAFNNCHELHSVDIPDTVVKINETAFSGCISLQSIDIPSSVLEIGDYVFNGCTGLKDIDLPNSIAGFGVGTFSGCQRLECIIIPEKITDIPAVMFSECCSLQSIDLPKSIKHIGDAAFAGCCSLNGFVIPNGVSSIGEDAFEDCVSLFDVAVPNSVCSIGAKAFSGCKELKSIDIPNSVKYLGEYVFEGCESIESITLGNNIQKIGNGAFSKCISLKSITIPDSVNSIGENAFYGCTELKHITLSRLLEDIPNSMFKGCATLKSVTIPHGVKNIGNQSFMDCSSLIEIKIPTNVSRIASDSFEGCDSLKGFYVDKANPMYLDLNGILFNKEMTYLLKLPLGNETEKFIIPDGILEVGESSFKDCHSLREIHIPKTIRNIRANAFAGCYSIETICVEVPNIDVEDNSFCSGIFNSCKLVVPPGTRWDFQHHAIWGRFSKKIVKKFQTENKDYALDVINNSPKINMSTSVEQNVDTYDFIDIASRILDCVNETEFQCELYACENNHIVDMCSNEGIVLSKEKLLYLISKRVNLPGLFENILLTPFDLEIELQKVASEANYNIDNTEYDFDEDFEEEERETNRSYNGQSEQLDTYLHAWEVVFETIQEEANELLINTITEYFEEAKFRNDICMEQWLYDHGV